MEGMMGEGDRFPLEQWFWEMPVCTRWWTTATVVTSALVQCQVVNAFQLFYSYRSVFINGQVSHPRPCGCPNEPNGANPLVNHSTGDS